tara:strand:+ start:870 stop:1244 length:375 start_codon:yes stop_codon:yes gene_type:complete
LSPPADGKVIDVPDIGAGENESDDLAQKEALSLSRGLPERDLKKEAEEADHDRGERFKGHLDNIAIVLMYVIAAALIIAGVVWFWHIITPCHFLPPEQLSVLQNMLTGGVLVSGGAAYVKKRLG